MEQTALNGGRRAGWSQRETNLLWETADEAQQQGLPLKSVFERIALQTGRRPNSIRNYYYAQVQKRSGGDGRTARFVPFTDDEVCTLLKRVLTERAKGHSVRSCLQQMSGGDHSLMLRYQNKYRSVIKSRPELVMQTVQQLRAEGVDAFPPEVNHRPRATLQDVCRNLDESARRQDDPELVRACEVLTRALFTSRDNPPNKSSLQVRLDLYRMALEDKQRSLRELKTAAQALVDGVKEFLGVEENTRVKQLSQWTSLFSERVGAVEMCLAQSTDE